MKNLIVMLVGVLATLCGGVPLAQADLFRPYVQCESANLNGTSIAVTIQQNVETKKTERPYLSSIERRIGANKISHSEVVARVIPVKNRDILQWFQGIAVGDLDAYLFDLIITRKNSPYGFTASIVDNDGAEDLLCNYEITAF